MEIFHLESQRWYYIADNSLSSSGLTLERSQAKLMFPDEIDMVMLDREITMGHYKLHRMRGPRKVDLAGYRQIVKNGFLATGWNDVAEAWDKTADDFVRRSYDREVLAMTAQGLQVGNITIQHCGEMAVELI